MQAMTPEMTAASAAARGLRRWTLICMLLSFVYRIPTLANRGSRARIFLRYRPQVAARQRKVGTVRGLRAF
jgi:hypothetical protein